MWIHVHTERRSFFEEYLLKNFNKRTKELTSVNTKKKKKKNYDLLYSFIYVSFIIQFSILYLAYWILSLAATSTNSVHNLILYIPVTTIVWTFFLFNCITLCPKGPQIGLIKYLILSYL